MVAASATQLLYMESRVPMRAGDLWHNRRMTDIEAVSDRC